MNKRNEEGTGEEDNNNNNNNNSIYLNTIKNSAKADVVVYGQ